MALTKEKKDAVIAQLVDRLNSSKLTVLAEYSGLSGADAQELRSSAKETGTTIKVVKNRLVKVALGKSDTFKNIDTSGITGQLIYAFNEQDEVASAQVLANFAKTHPYIKLKTAFTAEGQLMEEGQVLYLSSLPSKDQLRGQLIATIAAPLSEFVRVLSGNIQGLINVLNAHKQQLDT